MTARHNFAPNCDLLRRILTSGMMLGTPQHCGRWQDAVHLIHVTIMVPLFSDGGPLIFRGLPRCSSCSSHP